MHTLKWFINRIGKTVYRDDSKCGCFCCDNIVKNGVKIRNEQHAEYLHDVQHDFAAEGILLNYRDKQ